MVNFLYKDFYDVNDLIQVVHVLRGPGGCPWDREQTHESIRRDFQEEVCEVLEAIDRKDAEGLKEELGDVLLQVAFHTVLEEEQNGLTLDQVADGICKKLIYRHPHVFGQVQVSGTQEVLSNWEELKKKEKHQRTGADTMDAVARTLPALWRAEKVQKKAQKAGYAWPDTAEQAQAVRVAAEGLTDASDGERAIGDLLFAAVQMCRLLGVDPEQALNRTTDAFICDFRAREEQKR